MELSSPTESVVSANNHHRETDRLAHELIGGITYWATESENTPAKRLQWIRDLIEEYHRDIAGLDQ